MRRIIRIFIRIYQFTLSPVLAAMGASGCRFYPSCSEYFLQAVDAHGAWKGSLLGLQRIGRCHPWGGAGHDPVPGLPVADRSV